MDRVHRVFCRQLAINPSLAWNTLEPSLQAATILGQCTGNGTLCTHCQESDHTSNQCALAPLQQQIQPSTTTTTGLSQITAYHHPAKRPETLLRICVAWNKGNCNHMDCRFLHTCATCQSNHKAHDCPNTPIGSEYKLMARQLPKSCA